MISQFTFIAPIIAAGSIFTTIVTAQDASTYYMSRYFLAGFLLRAGNACDRESKRTIKAAFDLLESRELKMMSKAYPDTTKLWMVEGANNFNTGQ